MQGAGSDYDRELNHEMPPPLNMGHQRWLHDEREPNYEMPPDLPSAGPD